MIDQQPKTLAPLGALARGHISPMAAGMTQQRLSELDTQLLAANNYLRVDRPGERVVCMDSRLGMRDDRITSPRVAGGILTIALMYRFLYAVPTFEKSVQALQELGMVPTFHADCQVIGLGVPFIKERLGRVDAPGYDLLRAWGYVPIPSQQEAIADWAHRLPDDFIDEAQVERLLTTFSPEEINNPYGAGRALINRKRDQTFDGHAEVLPEGDLPALLVDLWAMPDLSAWLRRQTTQEGRMAAAALGRLFAAEVLLELAAGDLHYLLRG